MHRNLVVDGTFEWRTGKTAIGKGGGGGALVQFAKAQLCTALDKKSNLSRFFFFFLSFSTSQGRLRLRHRLLCGVGSALGQKNVERPLLLSHFVKPSSCVKGESRPGYFPTYVIQLYIPETVSAVLSFSAMVMSSVYV